MKANDLQELDRLLARLKNRTYEPNGSLEQFFEDSIPLPSNGMVYMIPISSKRRK